MSRADGRRRPRRGSTLLEALIALVLVATGAAAVAALASDTAQAVQRAHVADIEARRASAFLEFVALWTREELDRRLGDRQQGDWRLRIGRPHETLYVVTLLDSTGARVLLRTALHRPSAATEGGTDDAP